MLDRVMKLRRSRRRIELGRAAPASDPTRTVEERISHLEAMIEGLQDAVYREIVRMNDELDTLRSRMEPEAISKALSQNARERGL